MDRRRVGCAQQGHTAQPQDRRVIFAQKESTAQPQQRRLHRRAGTAQHIHIRVPGAWTLRIAAAGEATR